MNERVKYFHRQPTAEMLAAADALEVDGKPWSQIVTEVFGAMWDVAPEPADPLSLL